jgi:alpha-acetolactate decarboxylase
MDTLIISEYQNKIKKLIDTCKVYKNNLIFFPLQSYFTNSRQYLTRLKEFSNNPYVSIAPFQYNELKFQYAQMEICRNTLASAISYSGMMKEMDKSIKVLDSLKTHIDTTLQTIQVKMDTNFKNINTSVDTLNLKAIKIDQAVKKNKNKLNWTLGITTATGVVAIAILLITLLH